MVFGQQLQQQQQRQFQRRKSNLPLSKIIPVTILIAVLILIGSEDDSDQDYDMKTKTRFGRRRRNRKTHVTMSKPDEHDTLMDGGDCKALDGIHRPNWYKRNDIRRLLPRFSKLYGQRPLKNNNLKFDHSFALWCILKKVEPNPQLVIESDIGYGLSTWLIRQALPYTKIYSFNPNKSKLKIGNIIKFHHKNYKDMFELLSQSSSISSKRKKLKIKSYDNTIIFLNDYQSSYKRIFQQASSLGFKKFILNHNFPYTKGDVLSMKWLCEKSDQANWPGKIFDNRGQSHIDQSWDEHLQQVNEIIPKIKYYYEFPPVASSFITGHPEFDSNHTSTPLINDPNLFQHLVPKVDNFTHFHYYNHIAYIELE